MEFYSWWSSHQFISNRKVFCLRARIPRSSFNFILSPFMKQLLITSSNMVVVLSWCIKLQRAGKLPLQCFWEMLQNQMNGVGRVQLRCSLWLLSTYLGIILIWSFQSFQVLSVPWYFEEAHTQLCQPMTLSRDTTLFHWTNCQVASDV